MALRRLPLLLAAIGAIAFCSTEARAQIQCTPDPGYNACYEYTFTGADQSFTVPQGVTTIKVQSWGAGGGGSRGSTTIGAPGGSGAYVEGVVNVTPGSQYVIVVGEGGGADGTPNTSTRCQAAYGFGGACPPLRGGSYVDGGGGGGLSGLFSGSAAVTAASWPRAVLIAGGGGAGEGTSACTASSAAGGAGGNAFAGAQANMQGQPGAAYNATLGGTPGTGGGGGYRGGNHTTRLRQSGAGTCAAGANGGSNFIASTGITSAIDLAGNEALQASLPDQTIKNPPNTASTHYLAGVGVGQTALNTPGGNGLVVVQYVQPTFATCSPTPYLAQGSPSTLYEVGTSTNPFTFTPAGANATAPFGYNAADFNPADSYIYAVEANTNELIRIGADGSTFSLGPITGLPVAAYPAGAIGPDGLLYIGAGSGNTIYKVDLVTRSATAVSLGATVTSGGDYAWYNGEMYTSTGGFLYKITPTSPTTATFSTVGSIGVGNLPFGAMFSASNGIFGVSNSGGFYQFDPVTGQATLISSTPFTAGNNEGAKCPNSPFVFAADLSVTKTDNQTTYIPGTNVTYTIVARNTGPYGVANALVNDPLPAGITIASWTCANGANGGTCGMPNGTGAIVNAPVSLPVDATVTFTVMMAVPPGYSGDLTNTVTITAPNTASETTTANNTATDIDTLATVDLAITKTDGTSNYTPGANLSYTIAVTNNGPSAITGAQITDPLPAGITTASWTCGATSGAACGAPNGVGAINTTANLPVGGTVVYVLTVSVPPGFTGDLVNTASVAPPAGVQDTNTANNSATDTDTFGGASCGSGVAQTIAGNAQAWTTDSTWQTPAGSAAGALNAPDNVGVQLYSGLNNRLELDLATVVPAGETVTVYLANVAGYAGPALIQSSLDGNTWGAGVVHTPTTTSPQFQPFGYTVPAGGARYIRIVPQADASGQTAVQVDALAYSFQYCECAGTVNLVQQPSFEEFPSCTVQSAAFGNWAPIQNNIHIWGPTCGSGWQVVDGVNSVDLDGGFAPGGIRQTITGLNPGQTYNLTFSMSFNPVGGALAASMRVQIANFNTIYTSASNAQVGGFNRVYVEFTATSTSEVLYFHSLTGNGSANLIAGGGTPGYGVVVDDIRVTTKYCDDFSDAPASYGAPAHTGTGPQLGTVRDNEPAAVASPDALGDDSAGSDDEDGLQSITVRAGATSAVAVVRALNPTASPAIIAGWVDFNANGAFDGNERAEITVPANTAAVTPFTLTWSGLTPIPLTGGTTTFARFRIGTNAAALAVPIGSAGDGEVEDSPVTVLPPAADVQITKVGPATIVVGAQVTYTLTIVNNGPSVATAVSVADPTPAGVTFSGNSGDCVTAFPCALGDLAPGASRVIQTTLNVPVGYNSTTLTNTATASTTTPDPTPGNNTSTAVTQVDISADVAVQKTVTPDTGVLVGQQVTFTVSVSNNGPNTATNVIVTDVLPAGLVPGTATPSQGTYNPATGRWTIGALPVGAPAVTLTIPATVTLPGSLTNTATKTGQQEPDPNSANDSAVASINAAPSADVGVAKMVDNPSPSVGTNVVFTVLALNNGPTAVTNLVLTDLLPAGLTLQGVPAASQGSYDTGTGQWAVGNLAVSGSATLSIIARVDAAGPLVNTVTRTSQTEADVNPANDQASVSLNAVPSADLQVTKGVSNPTPAIGTDVTFTITVRNNGPSPASSVVVDDTLPAGLVYQSNVPSQGSYNSATGVWTVGALGVTQSATLTLTATVAGPTPAALTNTATASGAEQDPYLPNNTGNVTINSAIVADLRVTKTDNRTIVEPGLPVTYTIVVSNLGPSAVTDAPVTDAFPPELTGVTWTCTATAPAVCDTPAGAGTIAATVDLPAGGAATFTATGTLNPATPAGTLTNTATVAVPVGSTDPDLTNNTATDTSTIVPTADVQITKSGPATVVAGTSVTYTLTVTNNGPGVATGIAVTDPIPSGLAFSSVSAPCSATITTTGCALGSLPVGGSTVVTLTFDVPPGYTTPDPVNNTATVSTTSVDANPANNTAVAQTALAAPVTDLGVDKDNGTTNVVPGTTTTYVIRVTNAGPSNAVGAVVTDTFDATKIDVPNVTWTCVPTGLASCGIGSGTGNLSVPVDITADGSGLVHFVTFTVQAPVFPTATGVLANTVNVAAGPGQSDPNSTNDTDIDTLTPSADVAIDKSGPATAVPGTSVTYTIQVTNLGPSNAESVTLSDPLPAGLTFLSADAPCASGFPCDLGTLAPNAPVTIAVTYQVPANYTTPNPLVNAANVTSGTPDPNTANNADDAQSTVTPQSDVRITKSGPPLIIPGTTVSYTISVVNDGPSVAQNVMVDETVPAGVVFAGSSLPCPSFPCSLGNLAVGTPVTLTVQFAVSSPFGGANPVVNTATVSSPTDTNPANNTATASAPVGTPQADLSVEKSGPTTVAPGGTVTYSLVVRNAGPSAVTDGELRDVLPQGVTFSSLTAPASGACTTGSTVVCSNMTIPVGGTLTMTITGTIASDLEIGATLTNVTTVTSPGTVDPTPDNNRDEVDSRVGAATDADLAITKVDAVDPVVVGGTVTYTLNVINYGPATATNVTINDTLPPSLTLGSISGACTSLPCVVPSLAAGGTLTVTINATATAPGVVMNTATVSATEPDPVTANNAASEPTTVAANATDADLLITKSAPARAGVGVPFLYTITVTNRGPGSAANVQLDDSIPAGVTIQSAAASQGTCDVTTSIVCQLGTLPAGASVQITAMASAAGVGTFTNVATVATPTPDPDPSNNTDMATTEVSDPSSADLAVVKVDSPDPVVGGGALQYVMTVTNRGPGVAVNASLSDPLPAGMTASQAVASVGSCTAGTTVTCNFGDLPPGGIATVTILTAAPVSLPSPNPMLNTVTVTSNAADPDAANNTATEPTTIVARADVGIVKTSTQASVVPGTSVTYQFVVTNLGPTPAGNVVVDDPTPVGLSFVTASAPCAGGFPCGLGTLAPGASVTFTATYQVGSGYSAPNPIVNTTTVMTTTPDPNPSNNASSAMTPLAPPQADLGIVKSGPATILRGGQATYTLAITNHGPSDAPDVTVNDPTPAGLTFVAASSACAGGSLPCGLGPLAAGATTTITVTFGIPDGYSGPSPFTNTASVSSSAADTNPANNTSSASTLVTEAADVQVTKTVDNRTPAINGQVRFTVTVLNAGPSAASGIELVDQLPAGFAFVSASVSQGTFDAATGLWIIGALNNGASATLLLDARVTRLGPLANVARITHTDHQDRDLSNNSAGAAVNSTQPVADLQVNKTADFGTVALGDTVTYTIAVRNSGPDTAPAVSVNEVLPSNVSFVGATPSAGSFDPNTGVWTVGALAGGATATLQVSATVMSAEPVINTAHATDPSTFDPDPTNNTSGVVVNGQGADLQVVKTANATAVEVGQSVTFTIVVTNNGPANATGIQVREQLPEGLTYVSSSASQGLYVPETGLWSVGALSAPAGGASRATLTLTATLTAPGLQRNVATIAGQDQPDPSPGNDVSSVDVGGGIVDFEAGLEFIGDANAVGRLFDIFVTATNRGTFATTAPLIVAIPFPRELSFTAPTTTWPCEAVGRTLFCEHLGSPLSPDAGRTLTYWADVAQVFPRGLAAYAHIVSPLDDNPRNNVGSALLTPPATKTADVQVTQAIVSPASAVGSTVTYRVEVTNLGASPAEDLTLVDALPDALTLETIETDTGTCAGTRRLACALGTLAAGQRAIITVRAQTTAAGLIGHTVSVSGREPDPDLTNNAARTTFVLAAALNPSRDTDLDGMTDLWESQMGLDPAANDAGGDPDGDGLTNAQEASAGTHPRGFFKQYFAEGVSNAFFGTRFDVLNVDDSREASVVSELMADTGAITSVPMRLGALGRRTSDAGEMLAGHSGAFAAVIESDRPLAASRLTTWDARGYGSGLEGGLAAPATRWFFAEGATNVFQLFYLLENPDLIAPADVTVRYLLPSGAPIAQSYTVAPHSRLTIVVNDVPGLASANVSADITASRPIIAERAMYLSSVERPFEAGHVGAGATTMSPEWFFAEGATGSFFDLYLLLANPNPTAATVNVQYQLPSGAVVHKSYNVEADARVTVNVKEQDAQLAAATVAMAISASQPIVAERAMWWPAGVWYEATVALGATTTGTRWALAGAAIGGPLGDRYYALVANQAATAGQARVTAIFDDGTRDARLIDLPPTSRTTIDVASMFPQAQDRQVSLLIESIGAAPAPLVVEGAQYSSADGRLWSAGGAMLGARLP
jgi:uncharacterized repeat protein (TIGR01451 family)